MTSLLLDCYITSELLYFPFNFCLHSSHSVHNLRISELGFPVYSSLPQSKSRFPRLRLWHLCHIICMTFDLVALLGFILHKSMRSANLFGFIKEIHKKISSIRTRSYDWKQKQKIFQSYIHYYWIFQKEIKYSLTGYQVLLLNYWTYWTDIQHWISSSVAKFLDFLDRYPTLDIKFCCGIPGLTGRISNTYDM